MRTYEQVGYLEFTSFDNLFGKVLTTGKTIISNNPTGDPRSGGLPSGHPPLRHFLGVPISQQGAVVGLIGVANRSGGYAGDEQTKIELLSRATGVLYDSYCRQERELALEEELYKNRTYLKAVLDGTKDCVFVKDLEGKCLIVNGANARLLNMPAEEIIGKTNAQLFSPEEARHVTENDRRVLVGETVTTEETYTPAGSDFAYTHLTIKAPYRDTKGNIAGLVAIARDITEHKRAEEELQRRKDELAHMSRVATMGELATSIAHELNQPLTVILSSAGATRRLLAADEPDLEKLDEAQQLIVESATRAGQIIRHQYDFLRRGEVQKTPVAINELIRNIEQVIRAEVLRNEIALLLDLAPDLPSIMGDPIQLEQVILNLLRNSLEAMEDPAWGNRELLVQTSMSGPHEILLRVRDTGPPIDDEIFAQMFTPFHSTKPEGLGMGLAISRTIVEAHGGRLGATRNADLGITIDLTLACEEASSHTQPLKT